MTKIIFNIRKNKIRLQAPKNCVTVQIIYCSIDPSIRSWIQSDTYFPKVNIGDVIYSKGVGIVLSVGIDVSNFTVGDWITCYSKIQTYAHIKAKWVEKITSGISPFDMLTFMGNTGQTAYWGLFDVGKPKKGENVLVSGAAGAIGSIVCQLAKLHGCFVIGIAASKDKCNYLINELKIDDVINYKTKRDICHSISNSCINGVDIFFDNIGGSILDYTIENLNDHGRIVLCGGLTQYNLLEKQYYLEKILKLISKRGIIKGFIVLDYIKRQKELIQVLIPLIKNGQLKQMFTISNGIHQFVSGINRLFNGQKTGKMILKIQDPIQLNKKKTIFYKKNKNETL